MHRLHLVCTQETWQSFDSRGLRDGFIRQPRCLDTLDDTPRDAIRTAFFEGRTYAELADRMDVPLGTMKSWIRRGLAKLKACMEAGE